MLAHVGWIGGDCIGHKSLWSEDKVYLKEHLRDVSFSSIDLKDLVNLNYERSRLHVDHIMLLCSLDAN